MNTQTSGTEQQNGIDSVADEKAVSSALMSRLRGESLLLTAVYGLTALVGVAFWAVAARSVPPAKLGLSTAVISAFTAAAVIAATGVSNAFLAMVPIAGRAQSRLLRHGYLIVTCACLVTGAIAGAVAAMAVPDIGTPAWTMLSITVTSALWGLFTVQDSVLIALGKARWLLAENVPVSLLKLGMLPVLAVLFGESSHPVVVATAVPALLAVVVVSGFVIPRQVRRAEAEREADPDADPRSAQEWMDQHTVEFRLFAVRDGAASAMNLGLFMFLPFLVTAAAGAVEGAVFALCLQISNAMDLFTAGVGISLTTAVASDHAAGPRAARAMWKRLVRIVGAVAIAVMIGAPVLLWAFGQTYLQHNGWLIVVILAFGSLMRTSFEVWTALLRALRRTGVLLAWTTLTASSVFVLVVLGARLDGAVGAAWGVVAATAVSSTVGALGLLERIGTGRVRYRVDTRVMWPWNGHDPAPMDGVVEQATWFGPEQRPLFGWLSRPSSGAATLGVVLCQPVGEEARSAHRTFRRLGSELARRGVVALRVDYDGTGDSAGGQHDAERVAAWRASIAEAATYLRESGLDRVAIVGMRIGATLAAEVAAEDARFTSVVLWDPNTSGRGFLREGQALHALGDYAIEKPQGGDVHTPGFRYDATTAADLRTLNLADLPAEPWSDRILVLTRSGAPIPGKPGGPFTGPHVEWARAEGQLELVGVEPNQARTPIPTVQHVADWLAEGVRDEASRPVDFALRSEAQVTDPVSGTAVRERIVTLGPNRLFGIVTEPLEPARNAPWVILVNVAIELHIGPGRRWVDFARSWAAMGLRCVRLDQSGLGDSPRRRDQREDVFYDANWLEDLPDAIDALEAGDAPVSVFGLCSGAYSAFEAAMRRPLDAVYVVSPTLSIPQMARGEQAYDPRRIAARPFIRPLARLFQRNTMLAWGVWRVYRQFAAWHAPMSSMQAILRTGAAVRILCNRKDAEGYREVFWWGVVRRRSYTRTFRYDLQVAEQIDHALMTQRAQDYTFEQASRFWRIRYDLTSPLRAETGTDERARQPVPAGRVQGRYCH